MIYLYVFIGILVLPIVIGCIGLWFVGLSFVAGFFRESLLELISIIKDGY